MWSTLHFKRKCVGLLSSFLRTVSYVGWVSLVYQWSLHDNFVWEQVMLHNSYFTLGIPIVARRTTRTLFFSNRSFLYLLKCVNVNSFLLVKLCIISHNHQGYVFSISWFLLISLMMTYSFPLTNIDSIERLRFWYWGQSLSRIRHAFVLFFL